MKLNFDNDWLLKKIDEDGDYECGAGGFSVSSLIDRLRGTYRIPITDGLGPAGGEEPDNPNEFVRTFEAPPIQKEAAAELERLYEGLRGMAVYSDGTEHIGKSNTCGYFNKRAKELLGDNA